MRGYWLPVATGLLIVSTFAGLYLTGRDYDAYVASRGHVHVAPHGGALFAFGNHVGHIEFVLDEETRLLRAYVLDGHAEYPVRLPDERILLEIEPGAGREAISLALAAQASPLSGETVGDSSEFVSVAPLEEGLDVFFVSVAPFTFRGMTIEGLEGPFPEGNE